MTPQTYRPGTTIPVSGLYKTIHSAAHEAEFGEALRRGAEFPPCSICGTSVSYLLIQSVPDIQDDQDFSAAAHTAPETTNRPKPSI